MLLFPLFSLLGVTSLPLGSASPGSDGMQMQPTPWPLDHRVLRSADGLRTVVDLSGHPPPRTLRQWARRLEGNDEDVARALAHSVSTNGDGDNLVGTAQRVDGKVNARDGFYEFIPEYVGSAGPGGPLPFPLTGASPCFTTVTFTSVTISPDGTSVSATVRTGPRHPGSWDPLCVDHLAIGAVGTLSAHDLMRPSSDHEVTLRGLSAATALDVKRNGLRVFRFRSGALGVLADAWETIKLFFAEEPLSPSVPGWVAEENLTFLRERMDYQLPRREVEKVEIPASQIRSGDFFGIIRLDGLDPMVAFGMGSHTGHTTMALWIDGELYVVESQVKSNYWPQNYIQRTPYKQWLEWAERADFNVVHLPLDDEHAARFNETAAVEHFKSVEGVRYGYGNFLFGWIDTPHDNFPPPLSLEIMVVAMSIADGLRPDLVDIGWNAALNHRLNTTGLNTSAVYALAQERGISIGELLSLPELDSYRYNDYHGHPQAVSYVCDVLVAALYKAAGLFGDDAPEINVTEFTNWDVYSLRFFKDGSGGAGANNTRPQQCIDADPDLPYCQILGKYRMTLDGFNTQSYYKHMRERCGALPPKYERAPGC